ncbi:MAG: hypothetical protein DRP83_09725 [Planctomycetota bacterium]|nr:MAG: hypothetical protein DRP83_09725 [Planctomycetota bacterium]
MQITSNGRVRRSEAEWREILLRHEKSGLNPAEFCRKEKIRLTSFQRWQAKLSLSGSSGGFVEVTPESASPTSWTLEISLPGGCRLRFRG